MMRRQQVIVRTVGASAVFGFHTALSVALATGIQLAAAGLMFSAPEARAEPSEPRKVATPEKPEFSKAARPSAETFRCLVVFGLYTHILRIDDALADWRHAGKSRAVFTWVNCPPNAVEGFPATDGELRAYHAIVLSDVNYRAIGAAGFARIRDYVERGGKLLVTGGPYAFGNGEFAGTPFLNVLPVTLAGPFDLKWAGRGKSWELTPAVAAHPVLRGVSFAQKPRVFWHHFVTPKTDAEVVLKADDRAVLVLGRCGKGKVAALTLSPTGDPRPGETGWWDWEGWPVLMRNLFDYLAE
jgi:uncharacterized membrane protein